MNKSSTRFTIGFAVIFCLRNVMFGLSTLGWDDGVNSSFKIRAIFHNNTSFTIGSTSYFCLKIGKVGFLNMNISLSIVGIVTTCYHFVARCFTLEDDVIRQLSRNMYECFYSFWPRPSRLLKS